MRINVFTQSTRTCICDSVQQMRNCCERNLATKGVGGLAGRNTGHLSLTGVAKREEAVTHIMNLWRILLTVKVLKDKTIHLAHCEYRKALVLER